MDSNYIGIIDSGFGGLSVLNELVNILPNKNYIFYADSINSPFGNKNTNELLEISEKIVEKLISYNINIIVIACGTISTNLLEVLKSKYKKTNFVGTFPNFEQIFTKNTILNKGIITLNNGNIEIERQRKKMLILGTIATCKSKYLNDKINDYKDIFDIYIEPAQELVYYVENDKIDSEELNIYLMKLLKPYMDIDYLVLGCTHFPFLISNFKKILNDNIIFLDGCKIAAKKVAKIATNFNNDDNINRTITIIDTNINNFRKEIYKNLINTSNYKIEFEN